MGLRGHSDTAKAHPQSPYLSPPKSVRDIAASVGRRIARERVDARFVSTLAKIAARSTVVVGIADDPIKSARRLGFEDWEIRRKDGLASFYG